MKLMLKRRYHGDGYTIGRLFIDGMSVCDTLEPTYRGLKSSMSLEEIRDRKVPGKTAIPEGTYIIDMNTISQKYSMKAAYQQCGGKLPRLLGVKGFSGVLIHIGNTAKDTAGCIIVGRNLEKGKVLESTRTFWPVYEIMRGAFERHEEITIEICEDH